MAVGNSSVGQVVNIKLLREGKSLIVPVKVGKRKSETELAKKFGSQSQSPGPTKKSSSGKSGMLLAELTPELRRELDVNGVKGGVVITQIQSGSPAQAAMLSPGDVLVEIDRKAISNVKEAVKLLSTKKDSFLLKVQRRRASIIVFMDMNAVGDGESEAPFDDQRDDQ
jgi:serine protease Do